VSVGTALFSLHDLDRVEEFAGALRAIGWELIGTRETCEALLRAEIPVTHIDDLTGNRVDYGFPATLHPWVEAALTTDAEPRIDLVYVIPYPASRGNDVGGTTLLALAAKGRRIPVFNPRDMELVISELQRDGKIPEPLHLELLDKANAFVARHYLALLGPGGRYDWIVGEETAELLNGENPYQVPSALFSSGLHDGLSLANFKRLSGEKPCFTNMADVDCVLHTLCLAAAAFRLRYGKVPYMAVAAKHGNACGMAISWDDPAEVIVNALFGNPTAIWGGEFAANFTIDGDLARVLFSSGKRKKLLGSASWMLDVVLAPDFTPEAVEILGKRRARKLLANESLFSPSLPSAPWVYRFVRGGFLRQPPNNYVLDLNEAEFAGDRPDEDLLSSLIIAWAVAWSSSHGGNEIALAGEGGLIGAGGGPSTVEAVRVALHRARSCGHSTAGAVFAANAFFPFVDAPELLIQAGVRFGLVPKGGKWEESVRSLFAREGVGMAFLPPQYRGFSRH